MKIVGRRKSPGINIAASADSLRRGALFNDEVHRLPTGEYSCMPKGVYRYKTHEEANAHWNRCLVKTMADLARSKGQ